MLLPGKVMLISMHGDPLDTLGGIQSGGQNVYVRELTRAMDAQGVAVDVFTRHANQDQPESEPIGNRSSVIRLPAGHRGFLPKRQMFSILPSFIKELVQHMQGAEKYAVIHSNYWFSGWAGLQLQKGLGIPRIHISHSLGAVRQQAMGSDSQEPAPLRLAAEQCLLQKSECVIATTPFERDILINRYAVPPDRIRLLPCGIDTEIFHPAPGTPGSDSNSGVKTILFVGRFEENKGLAVLMQAIALLKNSTRPTPGFRLVIAGGDRPDLPAAAMSPEKKRYLQLIRDLGLHHSESDLRQGDPHHGDQGVRRGDPGSHSLVSFVGPQTHQQLSGLFARAWVTVVPSYYESFGLVALEAMACGCPVIASRTGGLKHIVINGKTGLHVEPKNPRDLARALHLLLTDRQLRERMSWQASLHGKQFAWTTIASKTIELYREVIRCSKSPSTNDISWRQIWTEHLSAIGQQLPISTAY